MEKPFKPLQTDETVVKDAEIGEKQQQKIIIQFILNNKM